MPEELLDLKPIIIGLIKDPRSLMQVRQTRLKMMGENNQTSDDINLIKFEYLRLDYFHKISWPLLIFQEGQLKKRRSVIKIYNTKVHPFEKIAITGKIGTGKSVLLNQFKFLSYKTYSSDQMVKDLYTKDKYIINEIRKLNSSLILNKKIRFDELSNKAFKEPVFY